MSICLTSPIIMHKIKSVQTKLESRKAAYKQKIGSPKLRDLLREKCKERIKDSRQSNFMNNRNLDDHKRNLIDIIVREELKNSEELKYFEEFLNEDYELQEIVYRELVEEMNEWLINEFEHFEEEFNVYEQKTESIFCPICKKFELYKDDHLLRCQCGISFKYTGTCEQFNHALLQNIERHDEHCGENDYRFFIEPTTSIINNISICKFNGYCCVCDAIFCLE